MGGLCDKYVVGVDFGTLSGRAVVVRVADGAEVGSAVHNYRHGVMDSVLASTGQSLPPDWALQDPEDYRDVLRSAVPQAVAASGCNPADIVGIATDFTASTVMPVLHDGTPLCQAPSMAVRPHAFVKLWKHHAAQSQADRINALARELGEPWLGRYGGRISAEWAFAKALQVLDEDPDTYARTERWIEAADWIVWQLCGTETRNTCTAGYKAIYQDGNYPSRDFLTALDRRFGDFVEKKIGQALSALGTRAGSLTLEASRWTGLQPGVAVCVGNVDAHVTAPAAKSIAPGRMLAVMGTSTCHVMNADSLVEVPGMCGVVDGGITAGYWGYEAGQSGVGDIFAWFIDHNLPDSYRSDAERNGESVYTALSRLAGEQEVGQHGLLALDWHNGNRSVLVDHDLSGLILGLTLATRPPDIYRALLESTAYGTRKIIETFETCGITVRELAVAGGLTKDPLLMQIYADVTRRNVSVIGSGQGPALGAAIHAAVAADAYPDVVAASEAMGKLESNSYTPHPGRAQTYDRLFAEYSALHDYFGHGVNDVMHRLRRIRNDVLASDHQLVPDNR